MLFFISLIMVVISSYMISCAMSPKTDTNRCYGPAPLLYMLLTMFSQVVLTMEILSLFKAINEVNVLIFNVLFLIAGTVLWNKKSRPLYIPQIKEKTQEILKAIKLDKILLIMGVSFLFLLIVALCMNAFMPVMSGDALTYHLNRASYWLHQGSLNHFVISDDRNLVMPINSEILYLWNLLFFKNDIGLYFISFIGYLTSIFCIYNILEYFHFSRRRILWSIFILSSFASVIVELSSIETDVLIAGLVLSSITLFLYSIKEKNTVMIFYSSLAYALAMGTKSPAVIAFPATFLLISYFAYRADKKEFYKPLMAYVLFLIINFAIFSSYNYVLNYIDYGNALGSESARAVHGFRGGIKAFVGNFIRYIFMLFDFSGFRYSEYVGEYILKAREAVLSFLHIPMDLGVEMSDNNRINNSLLSYLSGAGILGFLVFLPSLVISLILGVVKNHSKKMRLMFAFGAMFIINLICMSFSIAYMVYSVRFLTFLIVISSPILAVSYIKKTNFMKLLILFFVVSYLTIINCNISERNVNHVWQVIKNSQSLMQAREQIRCSINVGYTGETSFCYLRDSFIKQLPKGSRIAIFPNYVDKTYILDMLNSHGYKIDTLLPENALNYNYDKYDYIITTKENYIVSSVLLNKTEDIKLDYYRDSSGNLQVKNPQFYCLYENQNSALYELPRGNQVVKDSQCFISETFFTDKGFSAYRVYDFKNEGGRLKNFVKIYKKL